MLVGILLAVSSALGREVLVDRTAWLYVPTAGKGEQK
jgi:hypothetical protein